MATITENIKTIKDSTTAIKQAIIDKGGEVGDLTTYADAITNLPSGEADPNPTAEKNDVTFYDYDGTIRYSYTAEEFLALTEMPPLPTQKGLICQEWNWLLEDAKEYVAEYGVLDVGATYITDDGKTRLYIRIAAEGRMGVSLCFIQTIANGVTIDWGDGSATETLQSTRLATALHKYADIGDYIISLDVAEGCTLRLGHTKSGYCVLGNAESNGRVYCNMLKKIEIGTGVTSIDSYAFYYCQSLSSVVIPNSVTTIGQYAFAYCYPLNSVVIPNSVATIGQNSFNYCNLNSVVIPNSVTSIDSYAFYYCQSLSSVVIPNSISSIPSYMFQYCRSLSSVVIPNSISIINLYSFGSCLSLSSVVIPNSVTTIGQYVFQNCYSLSSVVIPNSISSIPSYMFQKCYGMAFYDFSYHTAVPKLVNTNAFGDIPSDCKIIVPDALYDEWVVATNWSAYATYTIKKSEWDNIKQGGSL